MKKNTLGSSLALLIIGIPFVGGSLFCFSIAFSHIRTSLEASNWDKVPAYVIPESLKQKKEWRHGDENDPANRVIVKVSVRYQYSYKGNTYTSNGIHPAYNEGGRTESHEKLNSILKEAIHQNKPVTAYINPREPSESYLATALVADSFAPFILVLPFFVVGIFLILGCISGFKTQKSTAAMLEFAGN